MGWPLGLMVESLEPRRRNSRFAHQRAAEGAAHRCDRVRISTCEDRARHDTLEVRCPAKEAEERERDGLLRERSVPENPAGFGGSRRGVAQLTDGVELGRERAVRD